MDGLEKSSATNAWDFIQTHFDVEQVATYFAVNMVLSHWDSFFNNYFTYHDTHGTGKWMMFPWDQDSTWGLRAMGRDESSVFYDMALTFGMTGDVRPEDGGFWRPPGWFSGPLLANPEFRKIFLARTRYILEHIYTEEHFGRILKETADKLTPEVRLQATLRNENPDSAVARLQSDLKRCSEHLRKRRDFLLAQAELKNIVPAPYTPPQHALNQNETGSKKRTTKKSK